MQLSTFTSKPRAQDFDRTIDLRFGVVKMRAESKVIASFPIVSERRDDLCFLQRCKELSGTRGRVSESRDARGVGPAFRTNHLEPQWLELSEEIRGVVTRPQESADGRDVANELYTTVNKVP